MEGKRRASMVLPEPGGPMNNLLDRTELAIVEEVEEIRYNGASGE